MRVESNRPAPSKKDGTLAWVHCLDEQLNATQFAPSTKPVKRNSKDLEILANRAYSHERANLARILLASELGVSVRALELLRVGYRVDGDGEHTLWPCRNANGEIVGAVRRYAGSVKKTLYGGSNGLFYSTDPASLTSKPVLVVEGGSDVAAAITIGMSAVGRPSNTGGVDLLLELSLRWPLLVVGERDEAVDRRGVYAHCAKDCTGCSYCYPGLYGAKVTAERIGCPWVLPPDGCKDLREVLAQGRVREFLRVLPTE